MRRRRDVLGRLYVLYHEVNDRHFAGLLPPVAIAVRPIPGGRKGARYIGETQIDERGNARCIVIDERFALIDSWTDITKALLHEIVHVWQAASGQKDTHGESFKRMAQRLGINPSWTVD